MVVAQPSTLLTRTSIISISNSSSNIKNTTWRPHQPLPNLALSNMNTRNISLNTKMSSIPLYKLFNWKPLSLVVVAVVVAVVLVMAAVQLETATSTTRSVI